MALFAYDVIKDPEVMTHISEARNGNGVHIYIDEPDISAGLVMATPVDDVFATKTKQFTWTCVFRATADAPIVAAEMSNPKDSYTLQLGINGDTKKPSLYKRPYAAIRDKYKWSKPGDHTLVAYDGKKGDYICLQTRFSVPQFDARNNVTSKNLLQFFFNGKQISVDQSFKTDADLRDVLSRMSYHGTYFTNVECTEHHLEYSGIVDGLPRDTSKEYVSWKGIVLCYMSVGGSAVITGKYKAVKPAFNGVLLGFEKDVKGGPTQADYHVFEEHQDPDETLTFLLTIGVSVVQINSDRGPTWESQSVKPGNDFVWLLVQNFDIHNVEIHTGMNPRK